METLKYSLHWTTPSTASPPSPEGELMETSLQFCPPVSILTVLFSPPSPEGELMETLRNYKTAS